VRPHGGHRAAIRVLASPTPAWEEHRIAEDRPVAYLAVESGGKYLAIKNERKTMHLLFSPVLASALYIGGGGLGLVLLIIILILIFR